MPGSTSFSVLTSARLRLRRIGMPQRDGARRRSVHQSSQIVSKSRSPLLSPPQMLHLFLSLPLPPFLLNPNPRGTSKLLLRDPSSSSSSSAGALSLRILSASIAWLSRSGASSIVSSDEIDGERERMEDGVEEMELKLDVLA